MNCPECSSQLQESEEEDAYGFFSETGIAGAVGAIILYPVFSFSVVLGIITALAIFGGLAYFAYINYKANQLYRCDTCSKCFRGNELIEVSEKNGT